MKIEIWHNILWAGYKAQVFSELASLCAEAGHDLTVYQIAETNADRVGLSSVDMSVHKYPMINLFKGNYSRISRFKLTLSLVKFAMTTTADVIILAGFDRIEYWAQALVLFLRGRQRAVFCDSTLLDNPRTPTRSLAKRMFFGMCSYAFGYGQRSKEFLLHFGVPEQNIFIPCQAAALPDEYRPETVADQRALKTPDHPVFLFVGRLSPEKRIETLLKAFAKALAARPTARVRIVGSGAQKQELIDLTKRHGIESKVDFVGAQSGQPLYDNFLSATCLVLPSRSEPWGLVVNESLHFGCPVIVSDRCGCIPELVEGSECGMVFPCDDVDALTDRLVKASDLFKDTAATTAACLARIAPYSPRAAARNILSGLVSAAISCESSATNRP